MNNGWITKIEQSIDAENSSYLSSIDFKNQKVKYKNIVLHRQIESLKAEEIVRVHFLKKLTKDLGYSSTLIELEKEYKYKTMGRKKGKAKTGRIDVILKDEESNPYIFAELKEPFEYESGQEHIEGKLFNLAEEEEKKYNTKIKYLVYYSIHRISKYV